MALRFCYNFCKSHWFGWQCHVHRQQETPLRCQCIFKKSLSMQTITFSVLRGFLACLLRRNRHLKFGMPYVLKHNCQRRAHFEFIVRLPIASRTLVSKVGFRNSEMLLLRLKSRRKPRDKVSLMQLLGDRLQRMFWKLFIYVVTL